MEDLNPKKKTFWEMVKAAGPAAVITSAFVGPGTMTTTTNAGVNFEFALLWAVVFSGISLIIIMNMASRLAIVGKSNIVDASVSLVKHSGAWKKFIYVLFFLVTILSGFGFETGNLIGATTGFRSVTGLSQVVSAIIMGGISLLFIMFSTPKIVEYVMKGFVALMGVIFIVTGIIAKPNWLKVLRGIVPSIPEGSMITTIALIGTTIIALNLIYHSIAAEEKWSKNEQEKGSLSDSFFDTGLNVSLGVIMTLGMIITTGAILFGTGTKVDSPIVFAQSLESTLGSGARVFASFGLILAGLSSATATPYMVGHITARLFKWDDPKEKRAKLVASVIVVFGTIMAAVGSKPVPITLAAQAMSGVMLPLIAIFFVIATNNKKLGKYKNTAFQNILGFVMVAIMFLLSFKTLSNVFASIFK